MFVHSVSSLPTLVPTVAVQVEWLGGWEDPSTDSLRSFARGAAAAHAVGVAVGGVAVCHWLYQGEPIADGWDTSEADGAVCHVALEPPLR